MLSVHRFSSSSSPSISYQSRCWSSALHSSFTCTFLLPSFFSSYSGGEKRYAYYSKLFTTAPANSQRYIHTQANTKGSSMTKTIINGFPRGRPNAKNPSLIHPRHTFSTLPHLSIRSLKDSNWITNITIAFPDPPPEAKSSKSPPPPPPQPLYNPHLQRFYLHGDLVHDAKFPTLFGFTVPNKPPLKNPRYEAAWIRKLLSGPFLPTQLREGEDVSVEEHDSVKLLLFLERARGHKHDLITELAVGGRWQHVVCIVRMLIEPGFEYPDDVKLQTVFEGIRYTSLQGEEDYRAAKLEGAATRIPSPAIAGRSGLWAVGDHRVKLDIERRRRGFGIVLGSLAGMVLRAGEVEGGLGNYHTDLMPTVRQVLAYLHTSSFIPDALYTADRHPRLYMLRSRILASLADAVWRAQEAMVAEEAEALGVVGEHRGFEVPRARYRLEVWGGGTKEISERPSTELLQQAGKSAEQIRQVEWGTYAEREVWLELILTIIVEAGYGNIGVDVIKMIAAMDSKNNTWNFIDYAALHPTEYTSLAIEKLLNEPKTGVAAQWALEGHSLAQPPVTTHPLSLPDWVLPGVVDAVVDSTAEGRGVENMFATILSYAKALPMRKETMFRLLRHPALIWSKNAGVMEVGAGLVWEFGDNKASGCNMYYTALTLHTGKENVPGAMRVWNELQKTRHVMPLPDVVVGNYLMFLVRNRKLGYAWDLLRVTPDPEVQDVMRPPVIREEAYSSPLLAPPLLALAVASEARGLYENVSRAIMNAGRKYGGRFRPRGAMWTSLINAHLAFGNIEAAKEVLVTMRNSGINPDGVVVGILVQRELQRDLQAGYKLAEAASGVIPFEPEAPKEQPTAATPQIQMSRDAWISVLSAAVSHADYNRTRWALRNLRIDLDSGAGLDTITFNILLKGTVERQGSIKAMEMCHRHHTRGEKRADGVVVGDAKSFRTVLHAAAREQIKLNDEEQREMWVAGKWWNPRWGKMPRKRWPRRGKTEREVKKSETDMEEVKANREEKRRRLEQVIEWCWNESRRCEMQISDMEKTVRVWLKKGVKPYSDYV